MQSSTPCPRRPAFHHPLTPPPKIPRGGWRTGQRLARLQPSIIASSLNESAAPDSLVVLPVFSGSSVLLPTGTGVLRAYEPRYTALFNRLGVGGSFLHILGGSAAPPAMLKDSPVPGFPAVGCCAAVKSVRHQLDGSFIVAYQGTRRVAVRLVKEELDASIPAGSSQLLDAVGCWYDDDLSPHFGETEGASDLAAAEFALAAVIKDIARLTKVLDPGSAGLPAEIARYAPRQPEEKRQTSYDALKRSGHIAATAIDAWRRHGSVYDKKNSAKAQSPNDPYSAVAEQLQGDGQRRAEMFSFAACQLLQLEKVEAAALLLSKDTEARLAFVLQAARPFVAELEAKVALARLGGE